MTNQIRTTKEALVDRGPEAGSSPRDALPGAGAKSLWNRRRLLYQILIADILLIVALTCGLAAMIAKVERHLLFTEAAHEAKVFADLIARESVLPVLLESKAALGDHANRALAEPDFLYIAWTAPDGRVIAMRSSKRWRGPLPSSCREGMECVSADRIPFVVAESPVIAEGQPGLLDWSDVPSQPRRTVAIVRTGISLERYDRFVGAELRSAVPLLLGILLAGCYLRLLGLRRISKPLRDLIQFTRRVGEGGLSARAKVPDLYEIAELAVAFNQMLGKLEADQRLREQMQAAEEANRLKTEFLANMSHEIRTPLNGIIGMTQLVLGTELSAEQHDYLEAVASSSHSLLGQLNGILDLSKIEAGKMELDPTEFEPADVIGQTVKSLAASAYQKKLRLMLHLQPEMARKIRADRIRVCQIVSNLVSNAIKFTDHGTVVVRAAVTGTAGNAWLQVSIEDTGIGIPEERKQFIFGAFTQANGSISRKYGGTGLGLAICSRLSAMMQATLDFDSTEGQGTVFRFSAPIEIVDAPHAAQGPKLAFIGVERELADAVVGVAAASGVNAHWYPDPATALAGTRECAFAIIDSRLGTAAVTIFETMRAQSPATRIGWVSTRPGSNPPPAGSDAVFIFEPVIPADIRKLLPIPKPLSNSIVSLNAALSRHRILVAEDSPVNQKLLSALLRKRGFEVTLAANGLEAVAAAEASSFAVILMDIQMPEMDGLEATQTIRAREAASGSHVPIIAVTANAMGGDRDRCLQVGMDAYLAKPISAADLYAAIDTALAPGSTAEKVLCST